MIFLPIARRELRVTAQKRSTHWVRLAGAGAALVVGVFYFAIGLLTTGGPWVGRMLFTVLTSLAFVAAMSAGMFFASDSLSEEKREGTLGFLFLTDLRGYDIVSGKLLGAGLRGFYVLLAALPVLAVTLLMGGVTGLGFWRTCLALLNALFFSLAAALFVSSISREAQRALLATMLLLIFWGGAGYLIDQFTSRPLFRFSSPLFTFTRATRGAFFWEALLVNQVIAWTFLALGGHFVARTWHDKPERGTSKWANFAHWLKYGNASRRLKLRVRLMGLNPITWLACRERWQAASFWVITAILLGCLIIAVTVLRPAVRASQWPMIAALPALLLYLGFASQACRFFAETRKNGVLELLLSTPLDARWIIDGQWKATLRMFALPLVLFAVIYFVGGLIAYQSASGANVFASLATAGVEAVVIPFDLTALAWVGMWMGLTAKSVKSAAWRTVLLALGLPMLIVLVLASVVAVLLSLPRFALQAEWSDFVQTAVPSAGSLATDLGLYMFARRRLFGKLRERAAILT